MAEQKIAGVIDIGSSAIRILISEIADDGSLRPLDRADRPLALGQDVFSKGEVTRASLMQTLRILKDFTELAAGYGLAPEDLQVVATSAVREATNRDNLIDRVKIKTGLNIRIVEGVEENYLTYIAVNHAIRRIRPQFARFNSMIIEVGGGTTELMFLKRGKIVAAHSLRLGTIRLEKKAQADLSGQMDDYIRENMRINLELLGTELPLERVRFFVAVGGDVRMAASVIADAQRHDQFSIIQRSDFEEFVDQIRGFSMEKIVRTFGISYNDAEGLVPALLVCRHFLQETAAESLIIPNVSLREGVLMSILAGKNSAAEQQFARQVRASAESLGRKYHYDEDHARQVTFLALELFDQLQEEHGLGNQARMLLEVAGILHDIGNFVRSSGHHKHGQYLVANSEIFGLSRQDIRVVSNVVRYHRKSLPSNSHSSYTSLRGNQRMLVQKLAAILRVADGLDRGHACRVTGVSVELREQDIILHCKSTSEISAEKGAAKGKADLFQAVFGYRLLIK